jgi:hypothetical protein
MSVDVEILKKYMTPEQAEKIKEIIRHWEKDQSPDDIPEADEDIEKLVEDITGKDDSEDEEEEEGGEGEGGSEGEGGLDTDVGEKEKPESITGIDWDNISEEDIPKDLSEEDINELAKHVNYDTLYKLLAKVVESKILQSITVPSHSEPSVFIERESKIGLPIAQQQKWEVTKSISSWGQLFPGTQMGKWKSKTEMLRGPSMPTRAEYAIVMDTSSSMGNLRTSDGKFVSGFILWLVLQEAKLHNDLVSFYRDSDGVSGGMGAFQLERTGQLGRGLHGTTRLFSTFDERALRNAQSMRMPATYDYDKLWNFFIKTKCDGCTALNVTPYYILAKDAKNRTPSSPLNLMIIGDNDDLDDDCAEEISLFLDFYERQYGGVNLSVIITKPNVDASKYELIEKPRSEGGLGGFFIHLPMGAGTVINPQLVMEKIQEVALRPNSPLRKMKFKTRI